MIGPDLVYDAIEKVKCIRGRMKTAQDRQRSYQDNRRRDLEFEVGDLVYLKVSPMKGVVRFGKKGKLSQRYIGPYKILKRIGSVAYEIDLPNDLAKVHPVFHVSMLRKFIGYESAIVPLNEKTIEEDLTYKEVPIEILDRQVKKLRNKEIASIKVLWRNQRWKVQCGKRRKI